MRHRKNRCLCNTKIDPLRLVKQIEHAPESPSHPEGELRDIAPAKIFRLPNLLCWLAVRCSDSAAASTTRYRSADCGSFLTSLCPYKCGSVRIPTVLRACRFCRVDRFGATPRTSDDAFQHESASGCQSDVGKNFVAACDENAGSLLNRSELKKTVAPASLVPYFDPRMKRQSHAICLCDRCRRERPYGAKCHSFPGCRH